MAVVQISKIQQRRGQKLLNGIPQLSSAELAWAVDTQELYIGNGSVAEGAPYVGNTKILTEHDNILALAGTYKFAENDLSITASIDRSFQTKLDEIEVSITDFGPEADPSEDHSTYFATAFDQLFKNTDTRFRKVLKVPNGHYYFYSVLKVPSNVIIKGETQDGVILDVSSYGIEFLSEAGTDYLNFTSTDHPENIRISNLTINYSTGTTNLVGLKNSYFEDVKWVGNYTLGDVVSTPVLASQNYDLSALQKDGNIRIAGSGLATSPLITICSTTDTNAAIDEVVSSLNLDTTFDNNFTASRIAASLVITANTGSDISAAEILNYFSVYVTPNGSTSEYEVEPIATQASTGINNTVAAVSWDNNNFGTRTTNINFIGCSFSESALPIKCIHTHGQSDVFETEIKFTDCNFFVCDTGVYIEGVVNRQQNTWRFYNCRFEEVAKQALFSTYGVGTVIEDCNFKNVGNGTSGSAYPETEMVKFGTMYGNVVINCRSDRHQSAGFTLVDTTVGVPEVINAGTVTFNNDYYADIYLSNTFIPLSVFSVDHRYIIIDYTLTLGEYSYNRKGQLTIVIADNPENTTDPVAIADNYTYSSSLITDPGGPMITSFEFNAELKDNEDTLGDSTASVDTILLTYKNPLIYQGTGTISYSIRYGV